MTLATAAAMLALAAVFVLWPLVRHWRPEEGRGRTPLDDRERGQRDLEELELDVASGLLSSEEAARRRADL